MITAEQLAKIHVGDTVEIRIRGEVNPMSSTSSLWVEATSGSQTLANAELVEHIPAKPAWHDAQVIRAKRFRLGDPRLYLRSDIEGVDWVSDTGHHRIHDDLIADSVEVIVL